MPRSLSHGRLLALLDYEPATGIFRWRRSQGKARAGNIAGTVKRGYVQIRIDRQDHLAHRLAWFYTYGEWPQAQVDHRNCDRSDNRIEFLREATGSQNRANIVRQKNNTSGFKGVSFDKQRNLFQARITKDRRNIHLGYFGRPELTHAAYVAAAEVVFGAFARFS